MNISVSPIPPTQPTNSDREVSKSAFEFLLAEILLQPAYLAQSSSEEKSDAHLHLLDLLGYDVGYRYAIAFNSIMRLVNDDFPSNLNFCDTEFFMNFSVMQRKFLYIIKLVLPNL